MRLAEASGEITLWGHSLQTLTPGGVPILAMVMADPGELAASLHALHRCQIALGSLDCWGCQTMSNL